MCDYLKIKSYLETLDFSAIGSMDRFLDLIEDKRILEDLEKSYGDDLSISTSPEFMALKEKYPGVC